VLIASFLVGTTVNGIRLSYGVFFKSLESEFELSRATTSGVLSVFMLLSGFFGFLGGWILDRYGPRTLIFIIGLGSGLSLFLTASTTAPWQLFVSYSLLLSLGTGAAYVVLASTASRWFERKRGLALAIVAAASGMGMVTISPLAAYLISSYDWRTSYIVLGLLAWLIVLPLSVLFKSDPGQVGALADGVPLVAGEIEIQAKASSRPLGGFSLGEASATRSFWLLLSAWLLFSSSQFLILTHVVPDAIDKGISAVAAAVIISIIGVTSIPSMLIGGRISDAVGRKVPVVICMIVHAAAMAGLIWADELWAFYLFAVIYGLARGGIIPPLSAMVGDIFGLHSIGVILGILNISWQIGAAIGPFVGGFIFDLSNSYAIAFSLGVLSLLVAALLVALVKPENQPVH
jgi:MFS family permease